MKDTLAEINAMLADGVITEYAIGGAVGATFYIEPASTVDIDVFVSFKQTAASLLISLSPIYEYLISRGHRVKGEYIVIAGWPVQFLPPGDALVEEALIEALDITYEGVPTRIMRAEHLAALALALGRPKDFIRVLQFVNKGILNPNLFDDILAKHRLHDKWQRFGERYLKTNG